MRYVLGILSEKSQPYAVNQRSIRQYNGAFDSTENQQRSGNDEMDYQYFGIDRIDT